MNLLKKTALGILVLGLMLGACACSKRMSIDKVEKVAEECGLEETGDEERLQKDVGAAQDYNEMVYYCSDKPKKAQKIYDIVFNRSNTYPAAEVTKAAFMYSNVINGNGDARIPAELGGAFTYGPPYLAQECVSFYFQEQQEGK